jgi:solute carrier family 9B (sodium/hydrogen exchanger), member 1/2
MVEHMMLSLAIIIIFGLVGGFLFKLIKLPAVIGMLVAGIVIGPFGLDMLDASMLAISSDLRMIALIIILLRAGLGINRKAIERVGKSVLTMSTIPVLIEGLSIAFLSVWLLGFDFIRGGMLGFIIAAVSPAIIVPMMLKLIQNKIGEKKGLPVLVLASASIDDVIAITLFSMFTSIYLSTQTNVFMHLVSIPVLVVLGILLGVIIGYALVSLFKRFHMRDSKKVVLLIATGIFMVSFADLVESFVLIAALLGVMTVGLVVVERKKELAVRLSKKFDKVWVFAELFLFVLVGAAVNIHTAMDVGLVGIGIVVLGLGCRSIGVLLATVRSPFNRKEKLFLVISYIPKATVQAAVGSVPLTLGVAGGEKILAISVLAIMITAPIGALALEYMAKDLLSEGTPQLKDDLL